mmetsp:Transcript_10803/g.13563  ORF Transcript_10803/g.13563 Transcript_10803/m.13563 type:complete len:160 (-) Transcript_10803:200-679(-)
MYDSEMERKAMVPPALTETHEEAIKETLSEQHLESAAKEEHQRSSVAELLRDDEEDSPRAAAKPTPQKESQKVSAAGLPLDSPSEEEKAPEQSSPVPVEPEKPLMGAETDVAQDAGATPGKDGGSGEKVKGVPAENMPAQDYVPSDDDSNYEEEEAQKE